MTVGPLQVEARVVSRRPVGAYHHLVLAVPPALADEVVPGHFVAVAVGGRRTSMLLRRAFSIYRADPVAGTIEVVFAVQGAGTDWMSGIAAGELLDVVAPLGRPFRRPTTPTRCLLVAGGYGAAPMFELARQLRAAGCSVDLVLGAATASRLFGLDEAAEAADEVVITTDDGSAGSRGLVTGPAAALLAERGAEHVYACGPMPMLAALAALAAQNDATAQCAVEEAMACGVGVCMTCVLPVVGADGVTRMVRSCTDGPVFDGSSVRWADVGRVPADALGAPQAGGH